MICEICGNQNIVKKEGLFVCQDCGCRYTLDEAKKLSSESGDPKNAKDDSYKTFLAEAMNLSKTIRIENVPVSKIDSLIMESIIAAHDSYGDSKDFFDAFDEIIETYKSIANDCTIRAERELPIADREYDEAIRYGERSEYQAAAEKQVALKVILRLFATKNLKTAISNFYSVADSRIKDKSHMPEIYNIKRRLI